MGWNSWVINLSAGANPPREWVKIVKELKKILSNKYIDKIELAAFVIRGTRKARWMLSSKHPEYSSKKDALGAAKKLTLLMIKSKGCSKINSFLKRKLIKKKKVDITQCPLCKKNILLSDFDKDGRKDTDSIQMGHYIPLSKKNKAHNYDNVFWSHRRCNYIQGEQTIKETIKFLIQILKGHNYKIKKKNI